MDAGLVDEADGEICIGYFRDGDELRMRRGLLQHMEERVGLGSVRAQLVHHHAYLLARHDLEHGLLVVGLMHGERAERELPDASRERPLAEHDDRATRA